MNLKWRFKRNVIFHDWIWFFKTIFMNQERSWKYRWSRLDKKMNMEINDSHFYEKYKIEKIMATRDLKSSLIRSIIGSIQNPWGNLLLDTQVWKPVKKGRISLGPMVSPKLAINAILGIIIQVSLGYCGRVAIYSTIWCWFESQKPTTWPVNFTWLNLATV